MLRTIAIGVVLLVGWCLYSGVGADEPARTPPALPPSASDSPAQAEIEARLRQPVMIELFNESLQSAIAKIAERNGLDMQLDNKALADAAIDSNVAVTFKTSRPIPLATALERMLEDFELTYVPVQGMISVTSREKADGILMTRIYPIEDLVGGGLMFGGDRRRPNLNPIVALIEDTIAPDSWDTNSGVGVVKPFYVHGGWTLVVANTYHVQTQVAALLADLRAVKHEYGSAPVTRTVVP